MASPNVPTVAFNKLTLAKNGEVSPIPNPVATRTLNDLLPQGFLRYDLGSGQVYTQDAQEEIANSLDSLNNINPVTAVNNLFTENTVDIVVCLVCLAFLRSE